MRTTLRVRSVAVPAGVGLGAVGYAWWVVGLPPFSTRATIVVVGTGMLAAVAGAVVGTRWLPARRRRATWRQPGLVVWLGLCALLLGWQLTSWMQHPRDEHPTLSSITNEALDPRPTRMVAFLAWLAVTALVARR